MAEQTSGRPAEAKAPKAEYKRTQVKTRNPRPGVYRTLDGNWEIERVDGSKKWSVFQVATDEAGKPTGERDLARKEAGVNERRPGATGTPRKTRGPGETIHTRKTRAAKVG